MRTDPYEGSDGLGIELVEGILHLRLSRPAVRNAIDDEMMVGLIDAIDAAGRDEQVRAILISGEGEHFCGGADIVARNNRKEGAARPQVGSIQRRVPSLAHRLIPLLCSVQVPLVCAVQGWAAGIGLHIAAAADLTVAASGATFWEPFASRGFTPDSGATWLLPRRVGLPRARELLLFGRRLSASEALEWQLVDRVVPDADLAVEAQSLVAEIASGPTVSLGLTKWLLHAGASVSLDEQLRNEAFALELSSRSEDFREGLAAFKDRRPPVFKGR